MCCTLHHVDKGFERFEAHQITEELPLRLVSRPFWRSAQALIDSLFELRDRASYLGQDLTTQRRSAADQRHYTGRGREKEREREDVTLSMSCSAMAWNSRHKE